MKIAIGCDEAAVDMKNSIIKVIEAKGYEVVDYGVKSTDDHEIYPNIAYAVANDVKDKKFERAILICGTGIGMAITANKVPGVRAAVCHDVYSAERARKSNNAQIMCLGARVIAPQLAELLVERWLESEFQGGGSTSKVSKICEIDGSL